MATGFPPDFVSTLGKTKYRFDLDLYRWVLREGFDEIGVMKRQNDDEGDDDAN